MDKELVGRGALGGLLQVERSGVGEEIIGRGALRGLLQINRAMGDGQDEAP